MVPSGQIESCEFQPTEFQSTEPDATPSMAAGVLQAGVDAGKSPEELSIIQRLKDLQRTDPAGRQAWWDYCEVNGGGVRDPAKHEASFVLRFFEAWERGEIEPSQNPPGVGENRSQQLVELLKEGQRRSQHWKAAWATYCQSYGGGVHDPAKHKQSFLVGFLDFLGSHGTIAPDGTINGLLVVGNGSSAPPLHKRQRVGVMAPGMPGYAPSGWATPGSGDPQKDALVLRIKAHQRQGEMQNKEWESFCDLNHSGVRDPVRHDKEVLMHFVTSFSVP